MVGIEVAVPVSVEPPEIETPVVAFVEEAAPVVEPPVDPPVVEPPVVAAVFVLPVVDACVCVAVERLGRSPPVEESAAEAIPAAIAAMSSGVLRRNFMVSICPPHDVSCHVVFEWNGCLCRAMRRSWILRVSLRRPDMQM
jgi:hypothetical protein